MTTGDIEKLSDLCLRFLKRRPSSVCRMPGGGGDRIYYRLTFDRDVYVCDCHVSSLVGVIADNLRDARAFVSLSEVFRDSGVNVPFVAAYADDFSCYITQDLGDSQFSDRIRDIRLSDRMGGVQLEVLLQSVIDRLVEMQTVPKNKWMQYAAYPELSRRQVMWDLYYFKYEYLKPAAVDFDENRLEDDFELLCNDILGSYRKAWGFMMRDCQSRNIMLCKANGEEERPFFIDYQGGRSGPMLYDAISLLWQAKADLQSELRERILSYYADRLSDATGMKKDSILADRSSLLLFRTLQVLGAYGFRGLVQKRAHFIESIPFALRNLKGLLDEGSVGRYPELERVAALLCSDSRFSSCNEERLHVKVFSFSYKKGYPEDYSGNGGGFMFDCRGMHNPGRYEEFKKLTGRDEPVIAFLRDRGEADNFAIKAYDLVSPSIERYLERGFRSLQIGFGCTGGQHRSVYCAERVARLIAESFPEASVELIHREQNIIERFN